MLGPSAVDYVSQLRALNPDLVVLVYGNACEVYSNGAAYAASSGDPLLPIPAQWLLTQVGATLTQDVAAATTILHVDRVALESGGRTYRLFVPGDTVVIDDELARVQAVDSQTKTLTVARGRVKPAANHSAGARVAATYILAPGMFVIDMSSHCPRVTVDPAVGPETWVEYNARVSAKSLDNPAWDGMIIDRSSPNPSGRVGGALARTIDVGRTNTLTTDFASFDASWNAGIIDYETRLRALAGEDRLLLVNNGMPNYGLLNGSNFEGFPGANWPWPWNQVVFGPLDRGNYFDWLTNARQPNLTTIETFEDEAGCSPLQPGHDNPASHPGFVPNFRKMRYGLCTALLNDGFFSYEISTNGHGSQMIDSTPAASGAVADQRAARTPQPVVEADAGRQAEEAREDALTQAGHGTGPVTLQREQILAGPEDRLDALADRREVRTWARFILTPRARHGDAEIGSAASEPVAGVALVADEQLTAAAPAAREQLEADLAFVTDGMGQLERPGGAVGGAESVQAHSPEPARVGGAVAVAGHICERRALDRLTATGALDRGRVDEQEPVSEARALLREVGHEPLDGIREAPATLEVAGLTGQLGKQVHEPLARDREEPAVGGHAHDRLGDAQGDHLGVGEPPAGVPSCLWQEIVGCAINDRAESVEVGVHRGLQADGDLGTVGFGLSALLSLCTADLVESII